MEWEYVMDDGVHKTQLSNEHQLVAGLDALQTSSSGAAIVVIEGPNLPNRSPSKSTSRIGTNSPKRSPTASPQPRPPGPRGGLSASNERPNPPSSQPSSSSSSPMSGTANSTSPASAGGSPRPQPASSPSSAATKRVGTDSSPSQQSSSNPFSWLFSSLSPSLSTRPSTLPPKAADEEQKHLKEYQQMLASFEKKVEEEEKKKQEIKRRREQRILENKKIWANDILPNYDKKRKEKRTRELWWQGIPAGIRAKVWPLAIGNDLHITHDLYSIMIRQAKNRKNEKSEDIGKIKTVELIPTDLPRTFPALAFYRPGGPSHDALKETLEAYAQYRPDIGYVQGMSYMAAVLLLYLDPYPAFCALCNLLNRPLQLAFYCLDAKAIAMYSHVFYVVLREAAPDVADHLEMIGMSTEMFLLDWVLTLFAKSLPIDLASRIWDVYILEGDYFLIRTAVAIFRLVRKQILDVELDGIRKVFSSLCENLTWEDEEELFAQIQLIKLTPERFDRLLAESSSHVRNNGGF